MAPVSPAEFHDPDEITDARAIGRSALWAGFALAALVGAILTARSETGVHRITEAMNVWREPAETAQAPVPQLAYDPVAQSEERRLTERVRVLSEDRERLLARLDALEQAIDVTGSVPKTADPAPPAAIAAAPQPDVRPEAKPDNKPDAKPKPVETHERSGPPVASVTFIPPSSAQPAPERQPETPPAPAPAAAPQPHPIRALATAAETAPEPALPRAEFGIDLGTTPNLERLRALWSTVRAQHGQLLEGLKPIVSARAGYHHSVELHLVAGPLADATAAARLCAVLNGTGRTCQPSTFDSRQPILR